MAIPAIKLTETDKGTKNGARKAIKKISEGKSAEFQKALNHFVKSLYADAVRLCPVGSPVTAQKKNYVGGALKKSGRIVQTKKVPKGNFAVARDIDVGWEIVFGGAPHMNWNTGKFINYAQAVHDGTFKQRGQPWLDWAFELNAVEWQQVEKAYFDWIDKIWDDKGKRAE